MPNTAVQDDSRAPSTHAPGLPSDRIIDPREERRNFRLIVINGIMTGGPSMLFEPTTVIAAFIVHLNGSQGLIGLVSALMMVGFVGPQFFVANWVEPKPKKLFVYKGCAFFRLGSLVLIAALMWVMRRNLPPWFLYVMISLLFVYWSAGGFGAVAWYEVLSKTVRSIRRPVVFAWRQTGAGVVALAAGIIVSWALGPGSGMKFPDNYLFLLILMTCGMAIGVITFTFVHEPADYETSKMRRPWKEYLRLGPQILRDDHNYRRLALGQISFAIAVMSTPFFVPFIIKVLHAQDRVIGILMALAAGTDLLVNVYWGHLGSTRGNRSVLVLGSKIAALSPIAALLAWFVPAWPVLGIDVRLILIGAALVISRVAGSGIGVGRMNYLLDIAPQGIRPSYIGFMNTFSVASVVMPVIAGNVIDAVGYLPVFALAAAFGIVLVLVILRLDDVPNGLPLHEEPVEKTARTGA